MSAAAPAAAPAPPGVSNPLDFLHKLSMQRGIPPPTFKQVNEQGPPHQKTFVWACVFQGCEAEGAGRSKKEAKAAAAAALKDQLNLEALPQPSEKKRKANSLNAGGHKRKKMQFQQNFGNFYQGPFIDPASDGFFADVPSDEAGGEAPQGPPMNFGYGGGPVFCSRLSKLDRYVIKKHKEIYPDEGELATILDTVRDTEEAMKQVSDAIDKKNEEAGIENPDKIKGMVRVGDFAKGLLLRGNRDVATVVMCQKPPTKALLETVLKMLPDKLKELKPEKGYQIQRQAGTYDFRVVYRPTESTESPPPVYTCNVALTSVTLRKKKPKTEDADPEKKGADNGENEDEVPVVYDEAKCLPKERCLQALADLRHTRWFCSMALNLPSCVECIRLVKDLAKRDPKWSVLKDWTVELLVERALYSAQVPLNPAASIMRVMEVVASGILLDLNQGLRDPCEHEDVDVTAYMTLQQREDITRSAQQFLRMMHFRQIHIVLGMPLEEEDKAQQEKPVHQGNGVSVKAENGAAA